MHAVITLQGLQAVEVAVARSALQGPVLHGTARWGHTVSSQEDTGRTTPRSSLLSEGKTV